MAGANLGLPPQAKDEGGEQGHTAKLDADGGEGCPEKVVQPVFLYSVCVCVCVCVCVRVCVCS